VAKIYHCVVPYSFLQAGIDALAAAGQSEIFGNATRAEEIGFGVPDDQVSAIIRADEFVEAKMAAMRAHATQITVDGPFFALSNHLGQKIWGTECFQLVHGEVGPGQPETDLFAGL
jgi:N-acetyl-1-D-myo-inositol-2-amino-2-deoxy-alpha-D-glucopyranoside deacetylase